MKWPIAAIKKKIKKDVQKAGQNRGFYIYINKRLLLPPGSFFTFADLKKIFF